MCRSVTSPVFIGHTLDFLNPLIMFTGVKDKGYALATIDARISVVMTRPGYSLMYLLHALLKLLLKDLKTPTSNGCRRWEVCAGKHKR